MIQKEQPQLVRMVHHTHIYDLLAGRLYRGRHRCKMDHYNTGYSLPAHSNVCACECNACECNASHGALRGVSRGALYGALHEGEHTVYVADGGDNEADDEAGDDYALLGYNEIPRLVHEHVY
jgi:hypothetical protein